jgi:predicted flap endonuclease-1-like 5' DNA nuclease
VLALLIGLVTAWWIFVASRRTTVKLERSAAEGAPARRNQALIDAPPVAGATAAEPAPTTAPASGDDLTRIKGLGPRLVALLADQGVTTFAQIAAWDEAAIDRVDGQLGRFQGRIRRDSWVEQAQLLAADDLTAYQARFGRTE